MCDHYSPFYRRTEPVARLVHRCDECYSPIMVGEKHVATSLRDDGGSVETWRAHVLCDLLANQVSVDDGCRMYGDMVSAALESSLTPIQAQWLKSLTGREVGVDEES